MHKHWADRLSFCTFLIGTGLGEPKSVFGSSVLVNLVNVNSTNVVSPTASTTTTSDASISLTSLLGHGNIFLNIFLRCLPWCVQMHTVQITLFSWLTAAICLFSIFMHLIWWDLRESRRVIMLWSSMYYHQHVFLKYSYLHRLLSFDSYYS